MKTAETLPYASCKTQQHNHQGLCLATQNSSEMNCSYKLNRVNETS